MRAYFIGAWDLVSQRAYRANDVIVYPRGENAVGRIMYDGSGAMSAQLMRVNSAFTDLASYRTAMEGYLAYFGTFRIDEAAQTVMHLVKGASYVPYIGTELRRTYEFSEDKQRLTLTAHANNADGEPEKRVLIWQRMG